MSASKNYQTQQNFVPYRPTSPKLTTHSPTTNQLNHNQTYTIIQQRAKQNLVLQTDHFTTIKNQNNILRQQNKALKKQLNLIKGQLIMNQSTVLNQNHTQVNDLRQTIKKQAGEIKQLKTRLQIVTKQCKMYEQIIDKMQAKINKLTQHNRQLEQKLKSSQQNQKQQQNTKNTKQKQQNLGQKINEITKLYIQLQQQVQLSDKEWEMWKQKWIKQKSYYLNRIHDLESLMGIGNQRNQTKQFYKKRF